MGIYALSNCINEICNYLGEDPLKFLERNSFYYNRKLENRKKYFLNAAIYKNTAAAQEVCGTKLSDEKFKNILAETKNILIKNNLILSILREISYKQVVFGKKDLYELMIPLKERVNYSEVKLDELFKFYLKNINKINQEVAIKVFLDKLLNPKNFLSLMSKLKNNSACFKKSFYSQFYKAIEPDGGPTNKDFMKKNSVFLNKYYIEKMKNMYDVGQEYEKKQFQIIC
jgi:hypothetical protein